MISYKAAGLNVVDETGRPDTIEFLNISQDDALAWPSQVHRAYPSTVTAAMSSTVVPFVRKSVEVNLTMLDVFNDRLGLPKGSMRTKHAPGEWSGSQARCTKSPPQVTVEEKGIGAHTDFGSLVRLIWMPAVYCANDSSVPVSLSFITDSVVFKFVYLEQRRGNMSK